MLTGQNNYHFKLANFLNPRYRGKQLKKLGIYDTFVNDLIESHPSTAAFREGLEESQRSREEVTKDFDSPRIWDTMDDLLEKEDSSEQDTSQNMPDLEREIKNFLILPPASVEEARNALEWWKMYSKSFPLLAALAKSVLSIPAASTTSERVFSASGGIISDKRHNLTPDNTKKLTLIKVNYDYIHPYMKVQTVSTEEIEETGIQLNPDTPGPATPGPAEPTPGPSGTQKKAKTPSSSRAYRAQRQRRRIQYSSSTPEPEVQPEPMQPPATTPRVTRRSSVSGSDTDSSVSIINPKPSKRRRSSSLNASQILKSLKSPEKASLDMFEDPDDDVSDPNYKPQ